jgi:MinD-like ATPase involved in chromosome partitioning or flagellar assembly
MTLFQLLGTDTIEPTPQGNSASKLIAVWGSSGSGKTLVALNLAFEIASLGKRVLLIDADSYGPSIAPALGLTEPGPGILAALRLARQSRLDHGELKRLSHELSFDKHTLQLLPGVTNPMRWSEFDEAAVKGVIEVARSHFDSIVVDVASSLEPGIYAPESSVSRNQSSLGFIEAADLVLGLFAADAIGVNRFLWDLRMVSFDYWPIANRVRSQALGMSPERQLKDAIYKLAQRELNHLLPEDSVATDTALQRAQPLLLAGRNSKLREGIRRLAIDAMSASTKLQNREH